MKRLIAVMIAFGMAAAADAQIWKDVIKKGGDVVKKGSDVVRASRDFNEDEEADIGRVVAARILATYPMTNNDKLQQYITLVGNTVAAYSARPTLEWHFAVIDAPFVNAFSAPGGYIFITTAALDQMHSEAELAAVLGHEIAHVTQKHILKEIKRANMINVGVDAAKQTSGGSFLNDDLGAKVSKIAYDKLFTTGLSRRDEEEADTIGTEIAASAGYKASEFLTFLNALAKIEGTSQMKMLVSTHPSPENRIAYLKPKLQSGSGVVLAERWQEWTKG
jgi:predicted Zn-dependent protease